MNDRMLHFDLGRHRGNPSILRRLRDVPGVLVSGGQVHLWADAVNAVRREVGLPPVQRPVGDGPDVEVVEELIPPRGFERLRPYQLRGASLLAKGLKHGLMYPCGTGKTCTGLAAIELAGYRKTLVLTRASGRRSWTRDAQWLGSRSVGVIEGRSAGVKGRTDVAQAFEEHDVLVCGYEVIEARTPELGVLPWDALILDESHNIKNIKSRRYRAIKQLAQGIPVRWGMTATPVRDRRRDLLGQLEILVPGRFGHELDGGGRWTFLRRYCGARKGPFGWYDDGPSKRCPVDPALSAELRERFRYYFDVRSKRELAPELPAKVRNIKYVTPTGDLSRYSRGNLEARLSAAAGVKLPEAVDLAIDSLNERAKVIVVTGRNEQVGDLHAALENATRRLGGLSRDLWLRSATAGGSQSLTQKKRLALVDEYMSRRGPACLVTGYDWFGESIDVQDTDHLIVCMLPWTPGRIDQLEGRVHRIGLSRPVVIDYVVAHGTIDDEIERLILSKIEGVESAGMGTDDVGEWNADMPSDDEVLAELYASLDQ